MSDDEMVGPVRGTIRDIRNMKMAIAELSKYSGDIEKIGTLTKRVDSLEIRVGGISDELDSVRVHVSNISSQVEDISKKADMALNVSYDARGEVLEAQNELKSELYQLQKRIEGLEVSPGTAVAAATTDPEVLERLDAIERDMQSVSAQTAQLESDISKVFDPIINYKSVLVYGPEGEPLSISGNGPQLLVSNIRDLIRSYNSLVLKVKEMSPTTTVAGQVDLSVIDARVSEALMKHGLDTLVSDLSPILTFSEMSVEGVSAGGISGIISAPRERPSEREEKPKMEVGPVVTGSTIRPTTMVGTSAPRLSLNQPRGIRSRALRSLMQQSNNVLGYGGPGALVRTVQNLVNGHNSLVSKVGAIQGIDANKISALDGRVTNLENITKTSYISDSLLKYTPFTNAVKSMVPSQVPSISIDISGVRSDLVDIGGKIDDAIGAMYGTLSELYSKTLQSLGEFNSALEYAKGTVAAMTNESWLTVTYNVEVRNGFNVVMGSKQFTVRGSIHTFLSNIGNVLQEIRSWADTFNWAPWPGLKERQMAEIAQDLREKCITSYIAAVKNVPVDVSDSNNRFSKVHDDIKNILGNISRYMHMKPSDIPNKQWPAGDNDVYGKNYFKNRMGGAADKLQSAIGKSGAGIGAKLGEDDGNGGIIRRLIRKRSMLGDEDEEE